ncbi:MAG: hypothetical protein NC177_04480 [Ruminococcus flavefaciens]|nr:hypothetical protein [Ruminococcus flavefaciens]
MKLTKKQEKEFVAKISEIKEIELQRKQLGETLDELKNEIKAFMDKNKTTELEAGTFTVHWTEAVSERFDSKAFKKDNEELYNQFVKTVTTKRFSIT